MMADLFVLYYVCVHVCMHALQLTFLDHNLCPKLDDTLSSPGINIKCVDFAETFGWSATRSALSPQTRQSMILHLDTIRNGIAYEALARSDKYLN